MNTRTGLSTTWYSYNLPNTINGPSSNSSQFFYGPDRARWKQVAIDGGTSEQTIYIGGLIEKVTLGGATHWKHYIAGGTGVVAEYIRHSTGTNETVYLLRDHLGSTEMITNSAGVQMSRLSYDAWGRRRNGGVWNGIPAASAWTTITNTTRHGFTSHEMIDNVDLVHMNGRMYDQMIGRFMSADPFIDGVGSTQGWNRYSYLANNPLNAIDPTGHAKPDRANVQHQNGRCDSDWGGSDGTTISPGAEGRYERGVAAWLATYNDAMHDGMAPIWSMSGRGWFEFNQMNGFRGASGLVRPQTVGTWVRVSGSVAITDPDGSAAAQTQSSASGHWELVSDTVAASPEADAAMRRAGEELQRNMIRATLDLGVILLTQLFPVAVDCGLRHLGEGMYDASWRNLMGVAPFGDRYDDPYEPNIVEFFRSETSNLEWHDIITKAGELSW